LRAAYNVSQYINKKIHVTASNFQKIPTNKIEALKEATTRILMKALNRID